MEDFRDDTRDAEEDGEGVSRYLCDISWIARSTSSRSGDVGFDGASRGVDIAGDLSLAGFFFFFLFLDFLEGADSVEVASFSVASTVDTGAMVASSSSSCSTSFNCY